MYEHLRLKNNLTWSIDSIIFDEVLNFLPKDIFNSVLDYGAGNSPFESFVSCDSYVKIDVIQNIYNSIDYIILPDESLPLRDSSFDLVLLIDVLEHVNNYNFVLSDIKRILKPGGKLIISIPFMYREHETPFDIVRFTSFGLKSIIEFNHGKITRLRKVGNFKYTLISLFLERGIFNGERVNLTFFGKLLNLFIIKFFSFFKFLISKPPEENASIYHHLLAEVIFE